MTNTQFYLGIAIPSVLIILGWLHQNTRLTDLRSEVNRGFDKVDQRFDKVDQRFERVEAHLARIDQDLRLFPAPIRNWKVA